MKHDELKPSRPGGRSWTRAEDYLPPRRNRRAASGQPLTAQPAKLGADERPRERPLLGLVPFLLLMVGMGVLAVAIAVAAWPGRHSLRAAPAAASATRLAPETAATVTLERR